MSTRTPQCRIGTSGYQYEHWRGVLYEEGLAKKAWFCRYAQEFDTVEINNTFYRLPAAGTFDRWRERAPEGFLYALKFSRYGSHLKRLRDPEDSVGRFVARAARLERFLGPILVQLPPNRRADPGRLARFLEAAPARCRWALEFRDPDWLKTEVFDVLRAHNAALCLHDMIADHPEEVTADWVYLRFHGDHYGGSYGQPFLAARADRVARWLGEGLDVFAYFNNDREGHAVRNARDLRRHVRARTDGIRDGRDEGSE